MRRQFIRVASILAVLLASVAASADTAAEIDANVSATFQKFEASFSNGSTLINKARRVLRVRQLHRIRQMVREELFQHFDLYLYINKAPGGVGAQHLFVYERQPDGEFRQMFRWLGSTGRERQERYFTTTPVGVFKLDPQRMREMYYSVQWDGVAMPYAMFIDFDYGSRKSGIAIHGTRGRTEDYLGRRASGGCIRLSVNNARVLYYLIRTNYAGMVPEFAFDRERGHTSKTGELLPVMKPGYRVLLIVDYVTN